MTLVVQLQLLTFVILNLTCDIFPNGRPENISGIQYKLKILDLWHFSYEGVMHIWIIEVLMRWINKVKNIFDDLSFFVIKSNERNSNCRM